MRLRRLHLQDFRAWGTLTVPFHGADAVRHAVVTGPNGAGKSSLIDGILWTLYGTTRSASSDSIVRAGATDTLGEVEFSIGASVYMVRRKRSVRPSSSRGELDLYALAPDGTWEGRSAKTARETQVLITDTIGVDVDVLAAASVVQQDDVGRFTRARPEARRDVLRRALGLAYWREWTAQARAEQRDADADAKHLEAKAGDFLAAMLAVLWCCSPNEARTRMAGESPDPVAAIEAALAADLEAAQAATLAVGTAAEALEAAQGAHRDAAKALDEARARAAEVPALTNRRYQVSQDLEAAQARVYTLDRVLDVAPAVDAAVAALPGLEAAQVARQQQADTLTAKLAQREAVGARWTAARGRVKSSGHDAAALAAAETADATLEAVEAVERDAAVALEAAEEERAEAVAAATTPIELPDRKAVDDARNALAAARRACDRSQADLERLQAERNGLQARAALLDTVPCTSASSWSGGGSSCDLASSCRLLADARAAAARLPEVDAALVVAAESLAASQVAVDEANQLDADAYAAHVAETARVKGLNEAAQQRGIVAFRAAQASRKAHEQARDKATSARLTAGLLASLRLALARHTEAQAEVDAITAEGQVLADEIQRLKGDLDQAGDVTAQLARARELAARRDEVERARGAIDGARAEVAAHAKLRDDLTAQMLAAAVPEHLHHQLAGAEQAAGAARRGLDAAREVERAALAKSARTGARAGQVRDLAGQHETASRTAAAARMTAVQAAATVEACTLAPILLIERAIPILEAEANRILAEVGTRGMQVRLDTTRTTQAGNETETLDVVVIDADGERPYEDFSGGERVRVDIAMRLGLSRLLAEREGIPIELLVIDEGGFGALDDAGKDTLKDVISGLVPMFHTMLVVTHLEAVADCLPQRIDVSRPHDGPAMLTIR